MEDNLSVLEGAKRPLDPRTVCQVFEDQLDKGHCSENTAIIYQGKKTTYRELNAVANQIAKQITKQILEKKLPRNSDGDYIIAVCMPPTDRLLFTLLAIWKAGAAYLPLDTGFPIQRIQHILGESKPAMVIYDRQGDAKKFGSFACTSFESLKLGSRNEPQNNIHHRNRFQQNTKDLAIVLYTSGSTGVPKGVRLPHSIIMNRLEWQLKRFPFAADEKVCVLKTALTFVDSVCEIWAPLINAIGLLVVPKDITVDPERLSTLLEEHNVQRLVLVPTLLRSLLLYLGLKENSSQLYGLKLWISSGEPLPVSLAKDFFRYFPSNGNYVLCNFYGSTEVMGDVTYQTITSRKELDRFHKIPIGIPLDNTLIYLLGENMMPVNKGERGELWVSGLNLADGYVNGRDPDRFIRNPHQKNTGYSRLYRTGDFALVEDGVIYYEGRSDSQVKIRGHRVDLAEVEKALMTIMDIDKGVVLCHRPGELDQALLAFVTSNRNYHLTGLHIERLLLEKLPPYMIPQVLILDRIPLLVNGKVDRQMLLKTYENTNNNDDTSLSLDIDYTGVAIDKMKAAEVLFSTVGTVIGRSARHSLTILSNFYELGGNSLNSIVTISKLRERGYHIGITEFITAKNLGEVLDIINQKTSTDHYQDEENSNVEPNFIVEKLNDSHKEESQKMIIASFYEKAELEQLVKDQIEIKDYEELLDANWSSIVSAGLSFVVRSTKKTSSSELGPGSIVGLSMNSDARHEPEDVELKNGLLYIFEFLEFLEGPIRDNLPPGMGKILHSFMMATQGALSPAENVAVIDFMERQTEQVAYQHNFCGVFTTNTSPLTQQLATDVLGYQVLKNYKVNEYVSRDGKKVFEKASDQQRVMVCWKPITC